MDVEGHPIQQLSGRTIFASRFERGGQIHRWVRITQRESLKNRRAEGRKEQEGKNFMPHFSAGKSLRGSHKSFAVGPRGGCFPGCVPLCTSHRITHGSKNFYPTYHPQWRRRHEIYERTKSRARKNLAKSSLRSYFRSVPDC